MASCTFRASGSVRRRALFPPFAAIVSVASKRASGWLRATDAIESEWRDRREHLWRGLPLDLPPPVRYLDLALSEDGVGD